jgi:hypothetical protein
MRYPMKELLLAVVITTGRASVARAAGRKGSGAAGRTSKGSGAPSNIDAHLVSFTSQAELKAKKKTVTPGKGKDDSTKSAPASKDLGFGRPLKSKRPSKLKPLGSI